MRKKFKNAAIKALMEPSHFSNVIKGKYLIRYKYVYDVSIIQDGPHDGQVMDNSIYELQLINYRLYKKILDSYSEIPSKEEMDKIADDSVIVRQSLINDPYQSLIIFVNQCNLIDAGGTIIVTND